jgi:hypothetical protein
MLTLDPFRLYRRHQRLLREAQEEAQYLRRRHGDLALAEAQAKIQRADLTSWGRRVLDQAIRILKKGAH